MWKCANCGKDSQDNRIKCWNCEMMKGESSINERLDAEKFLESQVAIVSPIIAMSDVPQSLQSNKPNDLPLNIILYGTLVLALYSAPATLLLGAEIINGGSSMIPRSSVIYLFAASLIGFTLFFGYFRTAVTKRHSNVFWICSSIYNLNLVCVYLFEVAYKKTFVGEIATESNQVIVPFLLSVWTMLASACSLYYVFNAWRAKQQKLD